MALDIYIPNTGQGDCSFIIFPNGKNMLIDFNQTSTDIDMINFLKEMVKEKLHDDINKKCRRINYFVNTHPHDDHLKGIGLLNTEDFYIDEIWDSNHRLYVPSDQQANYKNYYDFLELVNKLKKRDKNNVKVLSASRSPKTIGTSFVYTFGPSGYLSNSNSRNEIHAQCGIIKIEFSGNSILFAGDSDRDNWENRIVPHYSDEKEIDGKKQENLLKSNILHVSHHGSKHFFIEKNSREDDIYLEAIKKISPDYSIISVGEGNKHGHPHQLAIDNYLEYTKYKRVYTTQDKKSMFFSLKRNGDIIFKDNLTFERLITISEDIKKDESDNKNSSMSFSVDKNLELNINKSVPKAKREGYFSGNFMVGKK